MKFKELTEKMSEGEYRELDAFSYSLLKAIDDEGPMALVEREDKKSKAFEFGTMVDILLTDPDKKDDIFHTKTVEKPTAMLLALADAIIMDAVIEDKTFEQATSRGYVQNKIIQMGLWKSMVDLTKLEEKWNNDLFHDYIRETLAAKGKIVTTPELLEAATKSAGILRYHDFTKYYFEENESCEVLKQAIILYPFKGCRGKAKLDLIHIDHAAKLITPIDIKTGAELPSKFLSAFYYYKYYLQVISYMLAVEYVRNKTPEFSDYKIAPFKFMYLSKKLPESPTIWEVPEQLLNFFASGWDDRRGFLSLVEDYKYYKENASYSSERIVLENKGKLQVSLQ
jgi:hypothetical protein